MAVEQNVNLRTKISGADVFVAQIGVWNFALVERVANPSDRVGVGPRNPYADARGGRFVMRNVWAAATSV